MNLMIITLITWERQAESRRAAITEKPQAGLPVKPNQPPAGPAHTCPQPAQAAAGLCQCPRTG